MNNNEQLLMFVDKLIQELESNRSYISEFKDLKTIRIHIRHKLKEFSDDIDGLYIEDN